jgi:hypothetical protein
MSWNHRQSIQEDAKVAIIIRKPKKDRQHNGQEKGQKYE